MGVENGVEVQPPHVGCYNRLDSIARLSHELDWRRPADFVPGEGASFDQAVAHAIDFERDPGRRERGVEIIDAIKMSLSGAEIEEGFGGVFSHNGSASDGAGGDFDPFAFDLIRAGVMAISGNEQHAFHRLDEIKKVLTFMFEAAP